MEVKLPIGEYQFLAWAGARDSYDIYTPRGENTITDMRLRLKREESLIISKELEPLWYGYISDVDLQGPAIRLRRLI